MKTKVVKVDAQQPDPSVIEEAAAALREGKLVAFPTETVYGLGAHALDEAAVQKIFDAKERPATDPLIVHIAHVGQVSQCAASFPAPARKLALSFWARSEERRVGKECRCRGAPAHERKRGSARS